MTQKSILLIVAGGIAAYKALELVRLFKRQGIAVRAVMIQKFILLIFASMSLFLTSTAEACSPIWVPYLEQRPNDLFAVKAKEAWVAFTTFEQTNEPWSIKGVGVFYLRGIRCLSKPKGQKLCPSDLEIPFDEVDDGGNCGFYPSIFGPDKPVTDRYFYVKNVDAKWYIVGGARMLKEL